MSSREEIRARVLASAAKEEKQLAARSSKKYPQEVLDRDRQKGDFVRFMAEQGDPSARKAMGWDTPAVPTTEEPPISAYADDPEAAPSGSPAPAPEADTVEARRAELLAKSVPFIDQCMKARDKGSGLLFNRLHKNKLLFVPEYSAWHIWQGSHWKRVQDFEARECVEDVAELYAAREHDLQLAEKEAAEAGEETGALKHLREGYRAAINQLHSLKGVNAALEFSKADRTRLTVSSDQLDLDPFVLSVENGIVDLRTGRLREGKPEDYCTRSCPVRWTGLDTPCPRWEAMLFQILGESEDVLHYMHKLLGYAVCGENSEKIFVVMLGEEGDSGKTTIFETLYEVLTGYASAMAVELLLDQGRPESPNAPSPSILELKGQRICWASEPGENRRFSVDRLKLMTGNDSLKGRNPYDSTATLFQPTHTLFMLTNHKMRASANDSAFWKRLKLIHCPFSFVDDPQGPMERKVDKSLKKKILAEEASGVLAWLVRGYQLYVAEGLTAPEEVTRATMEYRREEDILLQFADDCLENCEGCRVPAGKLYEVFKSWFQDNYGRKFPSISSFGKLAQRSLHKDKKGGRVWYMDIRYTQDCCDKYGADLNDDLGRAAW